MASSTAAHTAQLAGVIVDRRPANNQAVAMPSTERLVVRRHAARTYCSQVRGGFALRLLIQPRVLARQRGVLRKRDP